MDRFNRGVILFQARVVLYATITDYMFSDQKKLKVESGSSVFPIHLQDSSSKRKASADRVHKRWC